MLPDAIDDREYQKFVNDADNEVAVRVQMSSGDIQIGAVELKDGTTDTRAL